MKLHFLYLILLLWAGAMLPCNAQKEIRKDLRRGNRVYEQKDYAQAEIQFRKALDKDSTHSLALYNLGTTRLRQQDGAEAMKLYEMSLRTEKSKFGRAQINHNRGVIYQTQKMYDQAIGCYKAALRDNPHDDKTRYNLALCLHQKKNQQEKNEENESNSPNPQNSESKQQPEENKKEERQHSTMPKDNAEQLLNVAKQEEQKTQNKVKKGTFRASGKRIEKNW